MEHHFGTSGLLYRSNKLMYDRGTQSLWSTLRGVPVVGPLVGRGIKLERLHVVTTTWGDWRRRHPNTTVLSLDTGFTRRYSEGAAYQAYAATDKLMFPVSKHDGRLPNKEEVLALIGFGGVPLAVQVSYLHENPLWRTRLGTTNLVVLTDRGGAIRVYNTESVAVSDWDQTGTVRDADGGLWTLHEDGLKHRDGRILRRYPAHRVYWFGWYAAYPETRLVPEPETSTAAARMEVTPTLPRTWQAKAEACLAGSPWYWREMQVCGDAIHRGANDPQVLPFTLASLHARRGLVLQWMGAFDEAIDETSRALALNPASAVAHLRRGIAHRAAGSFDLAIRDLDRAITLSPGFAQAFRERGFTHLLSGAQSEATEDLNRALTLNPAEPEATVIRGIIHYAAKRWDDAVADFDTAESLSYAYDYLPVWRYLARARRGDPEARIMAAVPALSESSDSQRWPEPLLRAYSGSDNHSQRASPKRVLEATNELQLSPRQRTEATFYLRELIDVRGERTETRIPLNRSANDAEVNQRADIVERFLLSRQTGNE